MLAFHPHICTSEICTSVFYLPGAPGGFGGAAGCFMLAQLVPNTASNAADNINAVNFFFMALMFLLIMFI